MKEFIEKSGLTAAQFAKKYGIPYNTVRQWTEGIRKAPAWMEKLFKNEQAYKPLNFSEGYLLKTIHEEGIIIDIFEKHGEMENVKEYYKEKHNVEFFVEKKILIEW